MAGRRKWSGDHLKAQREAAVSTRAQVAIAIRRSWAAVYQFETGHLTPGQEAQAAMADLFGCSLDSFYEIDQGQPVA
jgi:DNA-binding XRE family transcriptional regulator